MRNNLGEKEYRTYAGWKRACKEIAPNVRFEGDKDICNALPGIGEWDGEKGCLYNTEIKKNPAPRIGTAKPKRKSQVTGKPPTKRLVARRMANAKKEFFPNPISKLGKDWFVFAVQQTQNPGFNSVNNPWLNVAWSHSKERATQTANALFKDNNDFSIQIVKMKLSEFYREE